MTEPRISLSTVRTRLQSLSDTKALHPHCQEDLRKWCLSLITISAGDAGAIYHESFAPLLSLLDLAQHCQARSEADVVGGASDASPSLEAPSKRRRLAVEPQATHDQGPAKQSLRQVAADIRATVGDYIVAVYSSISAATTNIHDTDQLRSIASGLSTVLKGVNGHATPELTCVALQALLHTVEVFFKISDSDIDFNYDPILTILCDQQQPVDTRLAAMSVLTSIGLENGLEYDSCSELVEALFHILLHESVLTADQKQQVAQHLCLKYLQPYVAHAEFRPENIPALVQVVQLGPSGLRRDAVVLLARTVNTLCDRDQDAECPAAAVECLLDPRLAPGEVAAGASVVCRRPVMQQLVRA